MKTAIEVNSAADIISHLNEFYSQFGKKVTEIKFTYQVFDERNGWNTFLVTHNIVGDNEWYVAGMSDGEFKQ